MANPVLTQHFKAGFLDKLTGRDAKSTFESLKKYSRSADRAIDELSSHSTTTLQMLTDTIKIIDKIDDRVTAAEKKLEEEKSVKEIDNRLTALERQRPADVKRLVEWTTLVNKHSRDLISLEDESGKTKSRVSSLDILLSRAKEADTKTVGVVDSLSRRVVSLESQFKVPFEGLTSLEERLAGNEEEIRKTFSAFSIKFEEGDLQDRKTAAKLQELLQVQEELTAMMIHSEKAIRGVSEKQENDKQSLKLKVDDLAATVNTLVLSMTDMKQRQEQAVRDHQRHENLLLFALQMNQSIHLKLDLILQEKGVAGLVAAPIPSLLELALEKK